MSDLSNYAEDLLLNALLRGVAISSPPTPRIALFTAVTDAEAGTGTECAATGYSRQAVTFSAPSPAGVTANAGAVSFGPLSGSGTITHAAIVDSASGAFNALSSIRALAAPKAWSDGDTIEFAAGDIDFTLA